ncbi:MAG: NADPH:quinone reductase [Glaciihabitans sp.]|nr:NADPH:quinone reductase [Glaciihabitans sp.]
MRAVVVDGPGGPENLRVRDVPIPVPQRGWVLIRIEAFGLNRSELHFRSGVASSGSFPRIPGIEAVGTVELAPGGEFAEGSQVAAMMGGMGRDFDGGYAEYVSVPAANVIAFSSPLGWDVLGAVPEMLQTAAGSLRVGLEAVDGQSLLIRGGTSSVGLAIATLGSMRGMTVISTTRNPGSRALLERAGARHVVIDDGHVAERVREIVPGGVDSAIELVGVNVMRDTLQAVRAGGTVCFTGMLSDHWTIPEFYPMDWLPNGVRLTAYSGGATDLAAGDLQDFLDAVAVGRARVPLGRTYRLEEIAEAHRSMEKGLAGGKLVGIPR